MKIILWISLFFPYFIWATIARPPIEIKSKVAFDQNSKFTFNNYKRQYFLPVQEKENINIGYNEKTAVWCIYNLKNNTDKTIKFWLIFENFRLDSIQLFDGSEIEILGDRTTENNRFLTLPAFQIELKANESHEYVARLKKSISFMDFSFYLETTKSIENRGNNNFFLLSLVLGMIGFLVVFNSIIYLITGKKLYFLYVCYSVLSSIYIIIATGLAKFMLFPNFIYFSEGLIYFGTIWFIILFLFLSYFLQLKKNDYKLYLIICFSAILTTIYLLISVLFYIFEIWKGIKILSVLNYINFIVFIATILLAGIRHLKINKANGIYVLLSFIPHFVWTISIILKAFGLTNKDLHINWLVILSVYDIILFGFILVRFYFETFQSNMRLSQEIVSQRDKTINTILATQINERQSIANLIHDQFGSTIGHIINLTKEGDNPEVKEQLQDFSENIREVSHQIMPKSLELGALMDAMASQINIFNQTITGTKIEFQTYDFPQTIDTKKAQNLYLIFLELINNSRKHGGSKNIQIEFFGYEDSFVLQCTDDGKGFDKNNVEFGFGLSSIERRIKEMKGEFSMESEPRYGTIVQINLPRNL